LDCTEMNQALMEMWKDPSDKVTGRLTVGSRKALDKATELLSQSKMSIDRMVTKTFAERYGKVKDILNEGSQGLYDAIILGKRASYTLQWFFERPADEIAQSIVGDSMLSTPLWVCPEPEVGRKNVLVCVDGSQDSMRAVDHAGYILSRQDQHTMTLFYVENGAGLDSAAIFKDCVEVLKDHDIAAERIKTESTWGINVAGTILSYAEKNSFAAIAVGLHGQEQGILKSVKLAGDTTASLIRQTEKVALWCCP
ncbi:MAG: universal stress protein, partial [Desulfocapsaceae bacterium]|nr:universal stress protein [Desulfocapsaceae bacterium]